MILSRSAHRGIQERDWRPVGAGGESGSIATDPDDPNVVYGNNPVLREDLRTAQTRLLSPTTAHPGVFREEWTQPMAFGPGHTLYTANQFVFRTRDRGEHWQRISGDLTRAHPGVPATLDTPAAQDTGGGEARGVVYALAPSPLRARRRMGRDRRRLRAAHARRRPDVAQRDAARRRCVEPRRRDRRIAVRRPNGVRRGRPPPARRRPSVRLRHARRRAHVARGDERHRAGQLRLRRARRSAAPRVAVRRDRDRRLRVVRRRRGMAVAAAEHAGRLRARSDRARRRPRDRDARPRVLDPRRYRAAAPACGERLAGCTRVRAARRCAAAPVQRRSGSLASGNAGRREPAVRRADRLRRAARRDGRRAPRDRGRVRQRVARVVQQRSSAGAAGAAVSVVLARSARASVRASRGCTASRGISTRPQARRAGGGAAATDRSSRPAGIRCA